MELTLDANGIWTDNERKSVDYAEGGNNYSFGVEDKSFWFQHRNRVLYEVMHRFPFKNNFADVGGGNGYQAKFIADHVTNANVFLIEPGYNGCMNGRKRGLKNVFNVLFEQFDFEKHGVTAIGLFDVLEHIDNDVSFLTKLKEKLPPSSLIYITVPSYNALWSDVDDLGKHYRRYTLGMLKQTTERAGLEYVYGSYFFSYLPPLTLVLRSIPYRLRGARKENEMYKAETEQHMPSPIVAKVFDKFEKWELKKLQHSKISFGASCVTVLRT